MTGREDMEVENSHEGQSGGQQNISGKDGPENNDGHHSTEMHAAEVVLKPKVDMIFDSLADLMEFYHQYARSTGFPVSIKGVEYHTKTLASAVPDPRNTYNVNANWCRLRCSCGGNYFSNHINPKKLIRSGKTGCKAHLNAWKTEEGFWKVNVFVEEHNHTIQSENSRFLSCYHHHHHHHHHIGMGGRGRIVTNIMAEIP